MKTVQRIRLIIQIFVLLVLGVSLPLSYSATSFNHKTNSSLSPKTSQILSEQITTALNESISTKTTKDFNCQVNTRVVVVSILACLTSICLLSVIWHYFNNINITKECVLLYVYQDGVTIAMIADLVWLSIIISVFSSDSGTHVTLFQAKTLSFFIAFLKLELLLICNIISVIKLYTLKMNVIDPSVPWGGNEQDVMRIIRLVGLFSTMLFVFGMYAAGLHSKLHYTLIGEDKSLQHLHQGPTIFVGIQITLFILPVLAASVSLWYGKHGEIRFRNGGGSNQYPSILIALMTLVGIGIIVTIGSNYFREGCSLLVGQFVIVIGLVVMPVLVIIASKPLQLHIRKTAINIAKSIRIFVTDAISAILTYLSLERRFRRIYPLIE